MLNWFEENKKMIATVVLIIAVIWGAIYIALTSGAFKPSDTSDMEAYKSYLEFATKVSVCIIPIAIGCLAIIPLYNEDDIIISGISLAISLVCMMFILFTDGDINTFFSNIVKIDLILLLMYAIRTSSVLHRGFKIIIIAVGVLYMFMAFPISKTSSMLNFEGNSVSYLEMKKMSEKELKALENKIKFLNALYNIITIGIILNPVVALITDDGTGSIGGGTTQSYGRSESPLEMYNRLTTQGPPAPAQPAVSVAEAPAAPVPPGPVPPAPRPVGPSAPVPPAPPAPTPAPQPAQPAEQMEVPESMAFLFETNNQDNSNN